MDRKPNTMFSCLLWPVGGGHPRTYWVEKETETEWHVRRVKLENDWREPQLEVLSKSEWTREEQPVLEVPVTRSFFC
jgi:hypothetical protein